jgi:UDP-glucose 4-epimerase
MSSITSSYDMSQIVIVGANGFIGSRLSTYFKDRGTDVIEIRSNAQLRDFLSVDGREKPPVIVWAAAKVNPISANVSPEKVAQELLEWNFFCDFLLGDKVLRESKVVFLSSGGCVYSDEDAPFTESSASYGVNEYGRLKLSMEATLQSAPFSHKILRVANVYGPHQPVGRGQGVVAEWSAKLLNNEVHLIYGSLTSGRDYLFIDDLCEAVEKSLSLQVSTVLNIGSGEGTSLSELVSIFEQELNVNFSIDTVQIRDTDRDSYWLDISKAKKTIDWQPHTLLKNGVGKVLGSLKEDRTG